MLLIQFKCLYDSVLQAVSDKSFNEVTRRKIIGNKGPIVAIKMIHALP